MKLNATQLRKGSSLKRSLAKKLSKRGDIYLVLDKVLDTYNIGSSFRLADALGAKKILLCAGTEVPPNHKIKKASINTTEVVNYQYFEKTEDAIEFLRKKVPGIQILAIEQSNKSIQYNKVEYKFPLALVVGNETTGVSQEVLNLVDQVVELPMFGINVSLNVIVSLAIVAYKALENLKLKIEN